MWSTFIASVAIAQSDPPFDPAQAPSWPSALQTEALADPAPPGPGAGGRVALEALGGMGGGALLAGAGLGLGWAAGGCSGIASGERGHEFRCGLGLATGMGVGFLAGVPLGTAAVGDRSGGRGDLGGAALGTLAGLGAAIPLFFALGDEYTIGQSLAASAAPVAGAVIGYELLQPRRRRNR